MFQVLADGEGEVDFMGEESEVELENYEEIELSEDGEKEEGGLNDD